MQHASVLADPLTLPAFSRGDVSGCAPTTRYLSAHDSRIQASSTACYASTFAVDFDWQGAADAEQRWLVRA